MKQDECVGLCGGITLALDQKGFDYIKFGLVVWRVGDPEPMFLGSNSQDTDELAAMFKIATETVADTSGQYFSLDGDCEGNA